MRYWEVFKEVDALRREMEKAFNDYGIRKQPVFKTAFLPALASRNYPTVNLSEDPNNFYVQFLAPGVDKDSLDVTMSKEILTVSGQKNMKCKDVKDENYHRCERASGSFTRSMELPAPVKDENVKAEYKNGILFITLPKAEEAKPKRISISA